MDCLTGLLVLIMLCGLVPKRSALEFNDPCNDPSGKPGRCIFLRECEPLAAIFSKSLLTPNDVNFITKSRCGSSKDKPLVCCAGADVPVRNSTSNLLRPPMCGLDLSDRTVGGQSTGLDEFPWSAMIQYLQANRKKGFNCGGSLINKRYVLTSAHCIIGIPEGWEVLGVRLGEYDVTHDGPDCIDNVCADIPVDVGIEKLIVHEDYNRKARSKYNDIALIRMAREVSVSTYIKPICLPVDPAERLRDIVGSATVAAGWGRTETESASPIKLKVTLDIVDTVRCGTAYTPSGVTLSDTQLCAGGLRGKDTCSGDSGGPLMKRLKSTFYLYGIVSFGPNKCGTQDIPGIYTNVVKYIEWIADNLQ